MYTIYTYFDVNIYNVFSHHLGLEKRSGAGGHAKRCRMSLRILRCVVEFDMEAYKKSFCKSKLEKVGR